MIYTQKISFLAFLLIFFGNPSQGQDVDELGNLWIITLDKSRSMTAKGFKNYIYDTLFSDTLYKHIDFSRDRFCFYESGIVPQYGNFSAKKVRQGLKYENNVNEEFVNRFIRPISNPSNQFVQFDSATDLEYYVKSIYPAVWAPKSLPYTMSFVSLIRPLSLEYFLRNNEHIDLSEYDQIIVCGITDDADQNDQWLSDYKAMRYYAPEKQKEIDSILSRLIYNPFNLESGGFGQFHKVLILEKTGKPKLFAYAYETLQELREPKLDNSILSVHVNDADSIFVSLKDNPDNCFLIKIDSLFINDTLIDLPYPIKISKESSVILNTKLNPFWENDLHLTGLAQIIYTDSLLGKRIKTTKVKLQEQSVFLTSSPFHQANFNKVMFALCGLLFSAIIFYVVRLYRKRIIIISPSGHMQIYQEGFKIRPNNRSAHLAAYFFKDGEYINAINLKGAFIKKGKLDFNGTNDQWMAIATQRSITLRGQHDIIQFLKGSNKERQGIEDFHRRIRSKYGKTHNIYFVRLDKDADDVIFECDASKRRLKYNIAIHHQVEPAATITSPERKNEELIGQYLIQNNIRINKTYTVFFHEVLDIEGKSILVVSVTRLYADHEILPIDITLCYKLKVTDNVRIESLIEQEKKHLSKMLDQKGKGINYVVQKHSEKDSELNISLPTKYAFFPAHLYLFSNEDEQAAIQLTVYDPFKEEQYVSSDGCLFVKYRKPKYVYIENYSMQLLWHPHNAIGIMPIDERSKYAVKGENYLNMDNPDFIELQIEKNANKVQIKCNGHDLPDVDLNDMYIN